MWGRRPRPATAAMEVAVAPAAVSPAVVATRARDEVAVTAAQQQRALPQPRAPLRRRREPCEAVAEQRPTTLRAAADQPASGSGPCAKVRVVERVSSSQSESGERGESAFFLEIDDDALAALPEAELDVTVTPSLSLFSVSFFEKKFSNAHDTRGEKRARRPWSSS